MTSSLGRKIRSLRKKNRFTQSDLGRGLVSSSMISQIESDKVTPSAKLLGDLAVRLGVDMAYFSEDLSTQTDLVAAYRRAKSLMESRQFADAIDILQDLLNPMAPQFREETLLADLAECYLQAADYESAMRIYEQLVGLYLEKGDVPSAVNAYYTMGRVHLKENRPQLAKLVWKRASRLLSRHPEVDMPLAIKLEANLARVCLALGELAPAFEGYCRAAQLLRGSEDVLAEARILHGLATVAMEYGDLKEAREAIARAESLYEQLGDESGTMQCKINRAFLIRRQGNFSEALELLKSDYSHAGVDTANLLLERASCYLGLSLPEQAVQDARAAIEAANESILPYAYRIQALAMEQTADFAVAAVVWHSGASAAQRAGKYQEAIAFLNQEIECRRKADDLAGAIEAAKEVARLAKARVIGPHG